MITFSKPKMSARRAAIELNISKDTMYDLCRRKNQNFAYQLKPNGKIIIDTVCLADYLKKNNILVSRNK